MAGQTKEWNEGIMTLKWDEEAHEMEWQLQMATADYLTGDIYKGYKKIGTVQKPFHYLKFHHPALENREEGGKYKRRGSTPGIPDWLLWGPNKWHGMIELKVAGRGLSPNQKETDRWCTEYGFPFTICRTVEQFRDQIIAWGFPCLNMACREPVYGSPSHKKHLSFMSQAPIDYKPEIKW